MAPRSKFSFGARALPLLLLVGLGSWSLSLFLKLPVEMKDARDRDRKLGRQKFDLNQELEVRPHPAAKRGSKMPWAGTLQRPRSATRRKRRQPRRRVVGRVSW